MNIEQLIDALINEIDKLQELAGYDSTMLHRASGILDVLYLNTNAISPSVLNLFEFDLDFCVGKNRIEQAHIEPALALIEHLRKVMT